MSRRGRKSPRFDAPSGAYHTHPYLCSTLLLVQERAVVRERSERMTQELRRKYGEINVAVELIREIRDEA